MFREYMYSQYWTSAFRVPSINLMTVYLCAQEVNMHSAHIPFQVGVFVLFSKIITVDTHHKHV